MSAPARLVLLLGGALVGLLLSARAPTETVYPPVVLGPPVDPQRDAGSHPAFRTEWWYVTGWLDAGEGPALGFQLTFFRTRPALDEANPSAFAAHQILIAHAALVGADAGWHAEKISRAGLGLAEAAEHALAVHIDDWSLAADGARIAARAGDAGDGLVLTLAPTGPALVNGKAGYSQKGPDAAAASYYYSLPQLKVSGEVRRHGRSQRVTGIAWLDHEWSSAYLDAKAAGWDWIGLNLDDGGALMAFRIRDAAGGSHYAGGTYRDGAGRVRVLAPAEVEFRAGRRWRSPRTGTEYPVEWQVRAGELELSLLPLTDDQESDTRRTTGTVYWEGAVTARAGARPVGRGYLELTGYGTPLLLP